jgi:hypothetical protein
VKQKARRDAEIPPSSVLRTVFYTASSGALTFAITNALIQTLAISVILSILIGGIALLVRFLIDFERRLAMVEGVIRSGQDLARTGQDRMERLVGDAFAKINDATELFRSIEASALQTDLVIQLVRHSTGITQSSPKLISQFVRSEIYEMSEFLKEMSEGGDVTYYGEDRDWLLGLTRHATESINAISLASVDRGLWISEIGQRYLEAQRQAIKENHVAVRRIFILDDPEAEEQPDLRWACEEQSKVGIDVRVLDKRNIPPRMRVQVLDFIVFDGVMSYETTPSAVTETDRPAVAVTRLVLRSSRVDERSQVFQSLWAVARTIGTGAG